MAYTHNRIPEDMRGWPSFEIIKGTSSMFRYEMNIGCTNDDDFDVKVGEMVRYVDGQTVDDTVYKVDRLSTAVVTNASIVGVGVVGAGEERDNTLGLTWDEFNSVLGRGFPGAGSRGRVTTLMGSFVVRLRVEDWFLSLAAEINNGTACPGISAPASHITVEAGRPVFAILPSSAYTTTEKCMFATLSGVFTDNYAGATIVRAELARDKAVVGKIIRVQTHTDGYDYADVRFKL